MKVKITTVCNFSLEVLYFPNMNNSSQNKINLLEKVDNTQEILDLLGKENASFIGEVKILEILDLLGNVDNIQEI